MESLLRLELDDAVTAAVAVNNLYAILLSDAGGGGSSSGGSVRKVAAEGAKKLEGFLERSGERWSR